MKPHIDSTTFGEIIIDGEKYEYDIFITLDGEIRKRDKKVSKSVYGTSHKLSKDEAKYIFEKGAKLVVIGSGQDGVLEISDEALSYFEKKGAKVELKRTSEAIKIYNNSSGAVIGLFHITC
jgi:hypothetical protein